MREIKFRGHDGCDWIYSKSIDYCELDDKHYMLTGDICDGEDAWTGVCYVGQYTGLKDKKGKEIYEGDIVEVEAQCIGGRDFKGVVKFYDCSFFIDNGEDAIPLFDEVDPRIVLGNIYDNPELLEVPND